MTLVSSILKRGYRASNLVAISRSLTAAETTESLELLNGLVQGIVGNGAGEELGDLTIGGDYDQSSYCSPYVPENARLACEMSAAQSFDLHPQPYDGQRIAVAGDFATYNLTLDGNGRKIEAASSVTLSSDSLARQWLYRADTGNWVRITDLVAADTFPFPIEFDTYFALELALLLNPANSAAMPPESQNNLREGREKIAARYRRPRDPQDNGAWGLSGQRGSLGYGISRFNAGRP